MDSQDEGYIPHMLGKSRFNRRLHRIQDLFLTLFRLLGETWEELNSQCVYVLNSYPIATCDNYWICRSHILTKRGLAWLPACPGEQPGNAQPLDSYFSAPGEIRLSWPIARKLSTSG